jgi:hypothetical protein
MPVVASRFRPPFFLCNGHYPDGRFDRPRRTEIADFSKGRVLTLDIRHRDFLRIKQKKRRTLVFVCPMLGACCPIPSVRKIQKTDLLNRRLLRLNRGRARF